MMGGKPSETSFGETVKELRREKGWTVKDLLNRLNSLRKKPLSPPYITRIEVYGEIPSPEVICRIAAVLGADEEELLDLAKQIKTRMLARSLEKKYREAFGQYRKERSKAKGAK